jgi:hypothetical protein
MGRAVPKQPAYPPKPPFCTLPWCGSTGGYIEWHHKRRRSQGGGNEPDNLAAICHDCHYLHHSDARYTLTFGTKDGREYVYRADGAEGFIAHWDSEGETA